jgi:hypothetical protein
MRRSLLLLPLGLLACSDGRPGFDLLTEKREVSLRLAYRSPADPWPGPPVAGRPPLPPRPPSLQLRPGLPVPLREMDWTIAYQFDAPQARAALEALDAQGVLSRVVKTDPPAPAGPSYLLRIGWMDRNGGFTDVYNTDLGGGPGLVKTLNALAASLPGPLAAEVGKIIASVKD